MQADKNAVRDFWERASCGEDLYLGSTNREGYLAQTQRRYELEPYIRPFADFSNASGKKVLEIGVGLGADHQEFAASGAELTGIDLTARAVEHARNRLALFGLSSKLSTGDAENLSFVDATFDLVYSWGVIHHSPDTPKAVAEIFRVLKAGGCAKVMIYHTWSLVGAMLWVRYALLRLRPWMSLAEIYSRYLESPGTKAYSIDQGKRLFASFSSVTVRTVLTHGDLLESEAGQRHGGAFLSIARWLWPRALLRKVAPGLGLFMLISAIK